MPRSRAPAARAAAWTRAAPGRPSASRQERVLALGPEDRGVLERTQPSRIGFGSISGAPAPAGRIWKSMCGPALRRSAGAGASLWRCRRGRARCRRSPARRGAGGAGRRRRSLRVKTRGVRGAGRCGRSGGRRRGRWRSAAIPARCGAERERGEGGAFGQRRARLRAGGRRAVGAGSPRGARLRELRAVRSFASCGSSTGYSDATSPSCAYT